MKKLFLFTILLSCLGINYAYSMDNTRVFPYKKETKELEKLKESIKNVFYRFHTNIDKYIKNESFDNYFDSIHKLTTSEVKKLKKYINTLEKQEDYCHTTSNCFTKIHKILAATKKRHSLQCLAIKKLSHLSVKQINKLNIPHIVRKKVLKKLQAKSPEYAYEYAKMDTLKEKDAKKLFISQIKNNKNKMNGSDKINGVIDLITCYNTIFPQEILIKNKIIFQHILKKINDVNVPANSLFDHFTIFFIKNCLIPSLTFSYVNTLPGFSKPVIDEYKQNLYKTIQTSFVQMFTNCSKELIKSYTQFFETLNPDKEDEGAQRLITLFNAAKNQSIKGTNNE